MNSTSSSRTDIIIKYVWVDVISTHSDVMWPSKVQNDAMEIWCMNASGQVSLGFDLE